MNSLHRLITIITQMAMPLRDSMSTHLIEFIIALLQTMFHDTKVTNPSYRDLSDFRLKGDIQYCRYVNKL